MNGIIIYFCAKWVSYFHHTNTVYSSTYYTQTTKHKFQGDLCNVNSLCYLENYPVSSDEKTDAKRSAGLWWMTGSSKPHSFPGAHKVQLCQSLQISEYVCISSQLTQLQRDLQAENV